MREHQNYQRRVVRIKRIIKHPPYLYLLILLILIYLTINLIILCLSPSSSPCKSLTEKHTKILLSLNILHHQSSSSSLKLRKQSIHLDGDISTIQSIINNLLYQSTDFQILKKLKKLKSCSTSLKRRKVDLEFSVTSKYPIDGILLYMISILGSTSRTFIEIDHSSGKQFFGAASTFATIFNWSVYTMYETWSSYESARLFYLNYQHNTFVHDSTPRVLESLTKYTFGGNVDIAAIFPGGGDELLIIKSFINVTWFRPRLFLCFYQDYWSLEHDKIRTSNSTIQLKGIKDGVDNGRNRLFVGGSLKAVVRIAGIAGYKLVWCMSSTPIAFFIDMTTQDDNDDDMNELLLPSITTSECLKQRTRYQGGRKWHLDAEAMWDDAQMFQWKPSSDII